MLFKNRLLLFLELVGLFVRLAPLVQALRLLDLLLEHLLFDCARLVGQIIHVRPEVKVAFAHVADHEVRGFEPLCLRDEPLFLTFKCRCGAASRTLLFLFNFNCCAMW